MIDFINDVDNQEQFKKFKITPDGIIERLNMRNFFVDSADKFVEYFIIQKLMKDFNSQLVGNFIQKSKGQKC